MSSTPETRELEFALALRRALDENAAAIPAGTASRLVVARRVALAHKKAEPAPKRVAMPALAVAGAPGFTPAGLPDQHRPFFSRFALAWPLVALVVGLVAIAHWENQQRTAELADVDAAMMSDDLPLNAYLDHGFNAYLSRTR